MKKLLAATLVVTIVLSVLSCSNNKEGYTLNGTVKGADTGWVVLKKHDEGKTVTIDSVQMKNGKFVFKGKMDMPELYYLGIKGKDGFLPLFVENAKMDLEVYADSLQKSVVKGSVAQDNLMSYQKEVSTFDNALEAKYNEYLKAKEAKNDVLAKNLEHAMDSIQNAQVDFTKNYILKNGKSIVAPYLASSNTWMFKLDDLKKINKAIDPSLANSAYVKKLVEREGILSKVEVGQPAPEFAQNDTTGKPVSLSSFKGKVTLVDFWASWCNPCRAENPNVVAAFKKYGTKGFTVLGVSLDKDKEKWLKAIAKDNLTWTHVSDLKGWENEVAKMYGVSSIPANFLLDKDGKIIASGLHGEELAKKLEEVLSK